MRWVGREGMTNTVVSVVAVYFLLLPFSLFGGVNESKLKKGEIGEAIVNAKDNKRLFKKLL